MFKKQIDSVSRLLTVQKKDTAKARLYNRLSEYYSYDRDSVNAFKYAAKALAISEKEKDRHGKMDAYFSYALAYSYDKYAEERSYYKKILAICVDKTDEKRKVRALELLGMSIAYNVHLEKGIAYMNQALALAKTIGDNDQYTDILLQMGGIYHQRGKLNEAARCYQAIIKFNEKLGKESLSEIVYLADVYRMQENQAKALELFLKALKIADKRKLDGNFIADIANSVGDIYFDRKDYQKALQYYKQSEQLLLNTHAYISDKVTLYLKFSEVYLNLGNKKLSDKYLNLAIAQKIGNPVGYGDYIAKQRLGQNRFEHKKYEDALMFHEQSLDVVKQLDIQSDIAKAKGNMGACQYMIAKENKGKKSLLKASIANLKSALDTLTAFNDVGSVHLYSKYLTDAYEFDGQPAKALEAYKQHVAYQDSIFEKEKWDEFNTAQSEYEYEKKEILLKQQQKTALEHEQTQRNYAYAGVGVFVFISVGAGLAYGRKRKDNRIIASEKKRSDDLLLNILPAEVADELKAKGEAGAKYYDHVSILFTDFVGFTKLSEKFSPEELLGELNYCFKAFDEIITKHNIEKIKTIGDSYMAVSGLPAGNKDHAINAVNAAIEMRNFIENYKAERSAQGRVYFEMRTGINSGEVVAGIVGIKKFAYDVWGDAVNIASRMESNGMAGMINISESTYELVKDDFNTEYRGEIDAKGKGHIKMYFVEPKTNGWI